jgi:hypothetical protein
MNGQSQVFVKVSENTWFGKIGGNPVQPLMMCG